MKMKAMATVGGLRQRWLKNTASVIVALGLVCVLALTASFALYNYRTMSKDMKSRARTTTEFFANYVDQTYNEFYQSCITYANTFEDKDFIELQFINNQGRLVASSYGQWAGVSPSTRNCPGRFFPGCSNLPGQRLGHRRADYGSFQPHDFLQR